MIRVTDSFGVDVKTGDKVIVSHCGTMVKAIITDISVTRTEHNQGDDCYIATISFGAELNTKPEYFNMTAMEVYDSSGELLGYCRAYNLYKREN